MSGISDIATQCEGEHDNYASGVHVGGGRRTLLNNTIKFDTLQESLIFNGFKKL